MRKLCNETVQLVRPKIHNQGLCPEFNFAVSSSPEASTASEGTATPHSDSSLSPPVDPVGGSQVETLNNHYDTSVDECGDVSILNSPDAEGVSTHQSDSSLPVDPVGGSLQPL